MIVTSVSLPDEVAAVWRKNQRSIMQFAERYLRIQMRKPVVRGVTRQYNRAATGFTIVTTRWSEAEYDTLHMVAAALRVSVSSLICGLIKLWQKPSRHLNPNQILTNYHLNEICWRSYGGILEENILFFVRRPQEKDITPLRRPLLAA